MINPHPLQLMAFTYASQMLWNQSAIDQPEPVTVDDAGGNLAMPRSDPMVDPVPPDEIIRPR
jgi:hypothetical protein